MFRPEKISDCNISIMKRVNNTFKLTVFTRRLIKAYNCGNMLMLFDIFVEAQMSCWKLIQTGIFPPWGVFHLGWKYSLLVLPLTIMGWLPGFVAAVIIIMWKGER